MESTPNQHPQRPVAVYALTPGGAALARRIAAALCGVLHLPQRLVDSALPCETGEQGEPGKPGEPSETGHAAPGIAAVAEVAEVAEAIRQAMPRPGCPTPHAAPLPLAEERRFASLPELVARTFRQYPAHVFVAATGIVVRCIAPHLGGKAHDPCVVVCDQRGAHAVSLLSGHLGGGNDLARRVAAVTGGTPVITTATDTEGLPSLDLLAADAGMAMADIGMVRHVNGALLAGETVWVCDPANLLGLQQGAMAQERPTSPGTTTPDMATPDMTIQDMPTPDAPLPDAASPDVSATQPPLSRLSRLFRFVPTPAQLPLGAASVLVTPLAGQAASRRLVLHPRVLHVGVGCRRDTEGHVIEARIREVLAAAGLAPAAVAALASATLKADEPGLHHAARAFEADLHFFDAQRLAAVPVPHPSPKAAQVLGVASVGVAEAAALLSAGHGELLAPKSADRGVTVAVALGRVVPRSRPPAQHHPVEITP